MDGTGRQPRQRCRRTCCGRILVSCRGRVYFFTRLELCIEATLCDEHTAAIFFSDTVDTFMKNFRSAVLERRRSDPHFGSEIRKLQIRLNRSAAGQDAFDPDRPLP